MKVRCEARNVYQDKSTGNVSYGPWLPCSSPAIGGYINVRTTNEKPISSHDYSGIGLGQVGGDRYRISNPFNTKPDEFSVYSPLYKPQIQPYVRPEFVPYTPPVKSFLEEPRYIPPVIVTISSTTLSKLKEFRNEAQKLKDSAITPSDHIRADIAMNEAWRIDTECYREIAIKNNDHGKYGIEFRDKQLETHSSITLTKLEELRNEAQKLKDSAITPSDHLRADIAMNEAWRTDTEWHRTITIKTNNHGEYGIEFRNNQLETHNNITFSKIKDFTQNYIYINLSGLNINDSVAKLLADSLSKGEMPNLKKLHLEGNKITDDGHGFLLDTLKSIEQGISIVFKKVSGFSKEALKGIMDGMLSIAQKNGISTKEVLTTDETIEHCKKGTYNVVQNIAVGATTCTTPIGTVVDIYELNISSLFLDAVGVVYPPAKAVNMFFCMTEETAYSIVDEDFANCLVGVTKSLEE